jgi:16S rRNA (guanine966-N2)-methyltransferase
MRVIAGKARRLALKTVPGMDTRPTTDRIKETLFNMIQDELYGIRFLDLFSGSGAIGIEALSRGAKEAVFVEKNPAAVRCIRENLKFTRLDADAFVVQTDVFAALDRLEQEIRGGKESFGVIFMDPPYEHELEKEVLFRLKDSVIADEHTLIIVEASLKTDFSYLEEYGFHLLKRKEYKTNVHMFMEKEKKEL